MKFATFCCLLAFCAFEIVHADKDNQDVQKKFNEFLNSFYRQGELTNYIDKKGKKTANLLKAAKQAKKNSEGCQQDFNDTNQLIYIDFVNESLDCTMNAQKENNYQAAVDCCDKRYKIAVSKVDEMLKKAKSCLHGL